MSARFRRTRARRGRTARVGTLLLTALALSDVLGGTALPAQAQGLPPVPPSTTSAWRWIRSQLTTGTIVSTPSTITATRQYGADWTGAVSGSFVLRGLPTPPSSNSAPIVVDSPAALTGSYHGVVTGHLTLPAAPGRWIVNIVRLSPTGVEQGNLQSLVSADGTFTLDLAAASGTASGDWGLQVLDATQGYRQEGSTWPQPDTLDGLVVRALVVTDTAYVIGTTPANADGTFSFPSSHPGAKVFQLVDLSTHAVLAEDAPDTGLVRSYDTPSGDPTSGRTFTYDQALALITAEALGDSQTADRLARGLMRLQTTSGPQRGGFVTSAAALNPAVALPEYRTGNQSVATYALLRYLQGMSTTAPDRPEVVGAATRGVDWLITQQVSTGVMAGLVTGGYGSYRSDGSFDPATVMGWASTEHNLDAWHTLHLAASVLDDPAADRAADGAATAIVTRLWDPVLGRFLQGWQPDGPDPTPMLDLDSWGTIFLQKIGRPDLAAQALNHAQIFATSDPPVAGFAPRPPSTAPVVWFEGSAGVAIAQDRLGEASAAGSTLAALNNGQLPNGGWPEASRVDQGMDMTMAPAVAATAWIILAGQALSGHPTIWNE